MSYNILKTINGSTSTLHRGLPSHDQAHEMLASMAAYYKKQRKRVLLYRWMLRVNDTEIVYQIT